MATFKSATITAIEAGKPASSYQMGGSLKVFQEVITFASQPAADVFELFELPQGFIQLWWFYFLSVSAGTTTLAVGTSASTGKYRAAATATTIDNVVTFGVSANVMASGGPPMTTRERIQVLTATAALPASGFMRIGCVGLLGD